MLRYFDDPEATTKTMTDDGWVFTGDKGYRDESGWFYFVDRKVNMIKRAGENISTTEVENVLTAHPRIAEAAVIGVDDEIRDQAVKAFVLPVAGASVSEGRFALTASDPWQRSRSPLISKSCRIFPVRAA